MIDLKDEILQGEARYRVRDNNGNILQDNVQIEQITPVIQEGTPINKATFIELQKVNNYELMELESQDNLSEELTATNVFSSFTNITNSTLWTGEQTGKKDGEIWGFQMGTNTPQYPFLLTSSGNTWNGKTNIVPYYNSDEKNDIGYVNQILARTTYSTSYILYIYAGASSSSGTVTEVYFWWDMYKPCTPTFKYCINGGYATVTPTLYGSNDNASWTPLSTLSLSSALMSYDISTPYRYYKLIININRGNQYSTDYTYAKINNMYFTNVPDIERKYRNNFKVNNDFHEIECKNVIVPPYENSKYLIENTINGLTYPEILQISEYYKLRYNGEILQLNDNPKQYIVGTYTGNSSTKSASQTINLGFTPSAIYCASSYCYCFATASGYAGQSGNASNAIHSAGSTYGYVSIVDGGFKAVNGSDKIGDFNYSNQKVLYIAFR